MELDRLLSIFTTVVCSFGRLPQIYAVIKGHSVTGISRSSLLLEFWSYFTTVSYCFYFNYNWSLYAEYPVLLTQDAIIFALIIYHDPTATLAFKLFVPTALIIHSLIGYGLFPASVPSIAFALSSPIGILGKVIQLVGILRNKDAGNVSALSWFLNFSTSCSRLLSIYLTVFDFSLMAGLFFGLILNLSVTLAVIYYGTNNSHKEKKL